MITVPIAASSSGANVIVAAAPGYKYRVLAWVLSFGGTVNAKWQSASTDKTGLFYGAAGVVVPSAELPDTSRTTQPAHFETAANEALNLNLSGAVAVGGYVVYDRKAVGS